jgi:O-glycosyl hydrolase
MKSNYFLFFTLILLGITAFFSCDKEEEIPGIVAGQLTSTINSDVTYQTIAGFGGANRMWGTQFLKPEEAALAFGTAEGQLGLSIFRVRIASNPAEWPNIVESVQEAQNRGVKIIAAPWSPPYNLKSNNQEVGGYLLPENYEAFKDHINDFVNFMNQNGVDIYAISIQNEPDIQVSYESCDWSAGQMIDFISNYGHLIENTKISAPESFNFNQNFTNALLNNPSAVENFDIVAGHIYGGGLGTFPLAEEMEKEIWMTEYLLNLNTGNAGAPSWSSYKESNIWDETMTMLQTVHEAMSNNWNAYVWWYIQRYYSFIGDGTEGTTNGEVLKRGYAFSQFSKFVRPGFVRVDQTTNVENKLDITAYESNDQIVVVIINNENAVVNNFNIVASSVTSASAYETSLTANLAQKATENTDKKVTVDLSASSVTTVVIEK